MTGHRRNLLKATCFALSLTGATVVTAVVLTPDFAFAKNAKSQSASSKSQGSTHSGSKSNGSKLKDSKPGKSGGVQSKNSVHKSKSHGPKNAKVKKHSTGAHPSELGALNAAHANENALLNASPNSRVGRVAQYRDVVLAGQQLKTDLDAASEDLAGMTPPDRPSTAVDADRVATNDKLTQVDTDLAQLEKDIADQEQADRDERLTEDSPETIALKEDRDTLNDTKAALEDEVADLNDEFDDAVAYETAKSDVDNLQDQLDAQPELETTALEAAANKPVTEEVETAVKVLLGLE
jgi:hypothetical protein